MDQGVRELATREIIDRLREVIDQTVKLHQVTMKVQEEVRKLEEKINKIWGPISKGGKLRTEKNKILSDNHSLSWIQENTNARLYQVTKIELESLKHLDELKNKLYKCDGIEVVESFLDDIKRTKKISKRKSLVFLTSS